jgi:hypothetical protein
MGNAKNLGREAIRALLLALRMHKDNVDVQVSGLDSLFFLSKRVISSSDEAARKLSGRIAKDNCEYLSEPDALRILARQLDLHQRDWRVASRVCRLFSCVVATATANGQMCCSTMGVYEVWCMP